jgi:hypothetical protein
MPKIRATMTSDKSKCFTVSSQDFRENFIALVCLRQCADYKPRITQITRIKSAESAQSAAYTNIAQQERRRCISRWKRVAPGTSCTDPRLRATLSQRERWSPKKKPSDVSSNVHTERAALGEMSLLLCIETFVTVWLHASVSLCGRAKEGGKTHTSF